MTSVAASMGDKVLTLLNGNPGLSDRELTDALKGRTSHPSQINQACRFLESSGQLKRQTRADGRIGNYPAGAPAPEQHRPEPASGTLESGQLTEDQVKQHLKQWLEADGWSAEIAWGKAPGIDVRAKRGNEIWIIEAKGCGSRPEMRVNYFIAMLGELLQRMSVPAARYSIALPDMPQFRRLWERLPALARDRTNITALFVSAHGEVLHLDDFAEVKT